MIKTDPIIAVNDVQQSSKWYQLLLGCKSIHGGNEFDILVDETDEVILCLHKWGEHEHPTMLNKKITPGNGCFFILERKTWKRSGKMRIGYRLPILSGLSLAGVT